MRFSRVYFVIAVCTLLFVCGASGEDFDVVMARAKRGDIEAQCDVAYMYEKGNGV